MKALLLAGGAALALTSTLVLAQNAPESILPPGFDDPTPTPSPTPRPTQAPRPAPTATAAPAPSATSVPVIQPLPGVDSGEPPTAALPDNLPSLDQLETMDPDELDELLGLKPKYDIPPAARRSLAEVGVLGSREGGFPAGSLAGQPAGLVRAAIAHTRGPLVSRWGHILVRRALASRLAAPEGMDPVDFAALRAAALNSMGEYTAARAVVQDVDTSNWNAALTDAALDAYVATGDITGACPAIELEGGARNDAQWQLWRSICTAFSGQGVRAGTSLNRALSRGTAPAIDVLLAQRYAGAAGNGRNGVTLEWDKVDGMTPWRFALANAVGAEIPDNLLSDAPYYQRVGASSPMLAPERRAAGAERAAREGIFSSAALIDLYGQAYAEEGVEGPVATTAASLREAYVGAAPSQRLSAMREIWGDDTAIEYGRLVLTAYAAARMTPSEDFADDAPALIASMLTAGLDRDAIEWARVVPEGSRGWALLALAQPEPRNQVSSGQLDTYVDDDDSADKRKSRFLVAALGGLGRIDRDTLQSYSDRVGINVTAPTKWTRTIDRAADVDNPALVALLVGLGMQGEGWERMTARHLYHIVSALNRVGMTAEARMIAAEAVARA